MQSGTFDDVYILLIYDYYDRPPEVITTIGTSTIDVDLFDIFFFVTQLNRGCCNDP